MSDPQDRRAAAGQLRASSPATGLRRRAAVRVSAVSPSRTRRRTVAPACSYPPAVTEQPYPGQPYQQQYQQPYPGAQQQPYPGPPSSPTRQPVCQQPYAGQPYAGGVPGAPPVPVYPYAPWLRRVGAYLIDFLPRGSSPDPVLHRLLHLADQPGPAAEPAARSGAGPHAPASAGWASAACCCSRPSAGRSTTAGSSAGRTGQSLGKRVLKIKLRRRGHRSTDRGAQRVSARSAAHPRRHRLHRLSLAALGREASDVRRQADEDRGPRHAPNGSAGCLAASGSSSRLNSQIAAPGLAGWAANCRR